MKRAYRIMGLECFTVPPVVGMVATFSLSALAENTSIGSEYIDMPVGTATVPKVAADEAAHPNMYSGYRTSAAVSLSPYAPQVSSLPAGLTPAYGTPISIEGWRFEFSGYLQMPVVASIGKRQEAYEGQKLTSLHGDPVLPGPSWGFFDHTNTVPGTWSQVNFGFGNKTVKRDGANWRVEYRRVAVCGGLLSATVTIVVQ